MLDPVYWVVEFQYQNRGHRNTRLYPYNVFSVLLYIPCLWFLPVVACLSSTSSPLSPPLPSAADTLFVPAGSSPSCSHHLLATHSPDLRTVSSQRYIIVCVAMYCATIFFLFRTYAPISSNPASSILVPSGGYSQLPSTRCFVCLPVICMATLCWKNPKYLPMWGVITRVSDPNSSTACTTAL